MGRVKPPHNKKKEMKKVYNKYRYEIQRYINGGWETICFVDRKNSKLWGMTKNQWINDTPIFWRLVESETKKVISIKV